MRPPAAAAARGERASSAEGAEAAAIGRGGGDAEHADSAEIHANFAQRGQLLEEAKERADALENATAEYRELARRAKQNAARKASRWPF